MNNEDSHWVKEELVKLNKLKKLLKNGIIFIKNKNIPFKK